jgi:hypothetical protein
VLKVLVAAVKSTDSDAVRVAALLGLLRHAGLGIADAQTRDGELTPALLDLVKSAPPQGRSPEGHAWLRSMAIDVLAALHSVGPNGSVVTTLVGIVADKSVPITTRCAAARALGTFDYTGANFNALTASQLAVPIGQMAVEMCSAELKKTKSTAKAATKPGYGTMGSMPMGPMSMGSMPMGPMSMGSMPKGSGAKGSMPKGSMSMPMPGSMPGMGGYGAPGSQTTAEDEESAERTLRLRRNLKFYLAAARLGLNGPSDSQNGGIRLFASKGNADPKAVASTNDPDWKFVDNVFKAIQEQLKNLDDKDAEYQALAKEVVTSRNKLNDLLKGGPSAPPPAATGPAKGAPGGAAKKK